MIRIFVCGVNNYKTAIFLSWCSNDAIEFANTLVDNYDVDIENVTYATNDGSITNWDYCKKLKEFCDAANSNDILILFHSGHGGIDENDDNYLLMSNTVNESTRVYTDQIIYYLNNARAKSKLVLLDCCKADSGAKNIPSINMEKAMVELYMSGIAIMCSCKNNESSYLSYEKENISVFTEFLCFALTSKQSVRDGMVYLNDLFNLMTVYSKRYNKKYPDHSQTPIMRTSMVGTIALPRKNYKVKTSCSKHSPIRTSEFDILDLQSEKKQGGNGEERKYISAIIILRDTFHEKNKRNIIYDIVTYIKSIKLNIENWRQERVSKNPVEIIRLHIGADYIDYASSNYLCQCSWTLYEDLSWQVNTDIMEIANGYCTIKRNSDYDRCKQERLEYTYSDKDLISFWSMHIVNILNATGEFVKEYYAFKAGDFNRNKLRENALRINRELQSSFEECESSKYPFPNSELSNFDKLSYNLVENSKTILFLTIQSTDKRTADNFISCMEMELVTYNTNLSNWDDEIKKIKFKLQFNDTNHKN